MIKNRNINVPLLNKVMEHIENRPWEWSQTQWAEPAEGRREFLRQMMRSTDHFWSWKAYKKSRMNGMTKKETAQILQTEGAFTCDAAFCFAGWAAYFDGAEARGGPGRFGYTNRVIDPQTGKQTTIREYAQKALGLTNYEAADLFAGSNTLADLRKQVDRLTRRAS